MRLLPLLAAVVLAGAAAANDVDPLLRDADLARHAPASFRVRLHVTPEDPASPPHALEVWRRGPHESVIRFEPGRCLVRNAGGTWLVTPGARKPVKLGSGARSRGAVSLDSVLSARFADDYRLETRTALDGGRVRFDLVARDGSGRAAFVVDETTRRATSIEMQLPGGKPWLRVEDVEWQDGLLHRLRLCEPLRGGGCARILFEDTAPVELTDDAFDPATAAARACEP